MSAETEQPPMEATDCELMNQLATGDDLALNALMSRWRGRVAAFLYKMTGHVDTAADLAQETFVNLYQARLRYKPEGRFSTYLFAIAANLGRNHARWKMRHPTVSLDENHEGASKLHDLVEPRQAPDEEMASAEKLRQVNSAFLALPADLRETMTLFIYEGLGYGEIAKVARCSPKAVETRIYRARQILKEQLKDIRS